MDKNSVKHFAIVSNQVVTPQGVQRAAVEIRGSRIENITDPQKVLNLPIVDARDHVVMPGLVDTHVHINEPGRTEWEGFHTATRAAAAGGITTIVDMPLNCTPVTTTADALDLKLASLAGKLWIDCGFYGGVVPGNHEELAELGASGVLGFKTFLVDSGIDDFPAINYEQLQKAMSVIETLGVPLLVHAELPDSNEQPQKNDERSYQSFLRSRPAQWELRAIQVMIELCRQTSCPVHIVHLSSALAIEAIQKAKMEGLPITVETCPHYLVFSSEDIDNGATVYKCAPPIREKRNQENLWTAVLDGSIDFVVSDHSPCVPDLKQLGTGDFFHAWGGISSLQLGLSSIWTHGSQRGLKLTKLAQLLCTNPANFVGLNWKGKLEAGCDADIVIWDPEAEFTVSESLLHHRHKLSPYLNCKLSGTVLSTYVRGERVYHEGTFCDAPCGRIILGESV